MNNTPTLPTLLHHLHDPAMSDPAHAASRTRGEPGCDAPLSRAGGGSRGGGGSGGEGRRGGRPGETVSRLAGAARAFTTRRIPQEWLAHLLVDATPRAGDLVLARVTTVGQHARLHLGDGRRRQLFEGDEILVVYGNRYASDQFESEIPPDLGACHLVAGGGLAGIVVEQHRSMRRPTAIQPLGLISRTRGGPAINVKDAALPELAEPVPQAIPTLAVVGSSMNSGKTTAAAFLTRGWSRSGLKVGYIKATGTSAGGDPGLLADAGAVVTLDCVDAGHVTTYRVPAPDLERAILNLLAHVQQAGVDVALLEIADGLLQTETRALMNSDLARRHFGGVLCAAGDALGAAMLVSALKEIGHRVVGLTGLLTSAPLQAREAADATRLPVWTTTDLAWPAEAASVLQLLTRAR